MSNWFVAGTDTGVGKTTLCAAVVAAAQSSGLRAAGLKPIESGCPRIDGKTVPVPTDAEILCRAADCRLSLKEVCVYRFEEAVAPGVAAEKTGIVIDFEVVKSAVTQAVQRHFDLLLVEGAGGILVPLGENRTIRDLVKFLGLPVVVVGRAGLGTINHTLLTIEALRRHEVDVELVVLVAVEPVDTDLATSNAREIERACGIHVAGILPHFELMDDFRQMVEWVRHHLLEHFC